MCIHGTKLAYKLRERVARIKKRSFYAKLSRDVVHCVDGTFCAADMYTDKVCTVVVINHLVGIVAFLKFSRVVPKCKKKNIYSYINVPVDAGST